jgi:hypothetical protein
MDKQENPRIMQQQLSVIVSFLADILLYRGMGLVNIPVEFFVYPDGLFLRLQTNPQCIDEMAEMGHLNRLSKPNILVHFIGSVAIISTESFF